MKVHVLQHVPFEDIGSMAPWFAAHDADVTYTRFHTGAKLPENNAFDLIVVLGGPMSVNNGSAFPWLASEQQFIRAAVESGRAVIGVCLGAQLIASALGCRVYRAPASEIGWLPIHAVKNTSGFAFPDIPAVFQWHGETFDLPAGAVRLARSDACENQAFQLGHNVIALQFHLEITPPGVRHLIDHCGDELVVAPYVQSRSEILAVADDVYAESNALMDRMLSFVTR